jgi:hypothetical protein
MRTVWIDLDGSVRGTPDAIISVHYDGTLPPDGVNVFECPADYEIWSYEYTPKVSGVFDPDGFVPLDTLL